MKHLLTIISLVAFSQAQSTCDTVAAQIPSCATDCLVEAATSVGCSGVADYACQCQNSAQIQSSAAICILSACQQQASEVAAAGRAVCECIAAAGSDSEISPSVTSGEALPSTSTATSEVSESISTNSASGYLESSTSNSTALSSAIPPSAVPSYPTAPSEPSSSAVSSDTDMGSGRPTGTYIPIPTGGAATATRRIGVGFLAAIGVLIVS